MERPSERLVSSSLLHCNSERTIFISNVSFIFNRFLEPVLLKENSGWHVITQAVDCYSNYPMSTVLDGVIIGPESCFVSMSEKSRKHVDVSPHFVVECRRLFFFYFILFYFFFEIPIRNIRALVKPRRCSYIYLAKQVTATCRKDRKCRTNASITKYVYKRNDYWIEG